MNIAYASLLVGLALSIALIYLVIVVNSSPGSTRSS